MSIEIYSKATIIKKDNTYYYFLKHHSKNDAICRGQYTVDGNFNTKYLRRDGRAGTWSVKAHGDGEMWRTNQIAKTCYNAPTSYMYGRILFGNKLNIALFWSKTKPKAIESFTEEQQKNINDIIEWYNRDDNQYKLDLLHIPEGKKMKTVHGYVDSKTWDIKDHSITYQDKLYWNLNNL